MKPFSAVMRAFLRAGIFTGAPVAGLRPIRALVSTRANFAKPEMATGSPLAATPMMTSVRPLSAASTARASWPVCTATAFTNWERFNTSSCRLVTR